MSKNAMIAASIVVALVLILALLLKDQLFDPSLPGIVSDPAIESSSSELADSPLIPTRDELTDIQIDPGVVLLSGKVLTPEGAAAGAAEVFLYRANFPAYVSERDGLSVWEVLDWNLLRSSWQQVTSLPLRENLARALTVVDQVLADESGHYQFHDLEPGRYLLAASAPGTLLTPFPEIIDFDGTPQKQDILCRSGSSLTVRVRAGNSPGQDANVYLRGSIVDSGSGSEAWYMTREELTLFMLNPPIRLGRADEDGLVHFPRLPLIEYQVIVQKKPWAQITRRVLLEDPQEITVELEPGAIIDGIVVSSDGAVVAGAHVRLAEANWNNWGQIPPPLPDTHSGSDGRFLLEGVPPGSYDIRTESMGFVDGRLRGIEIVFDETVPAEVVLERGAVVRGIVRDEEGQPLGEIDVTVNIDQRNRGGTEERTKTFDNGEFVIDTLPAGSYRVTCTGDGWRRWRETVPADGPYLEVTMKAAPVLTGRVIDSRGKAVSRARVQIDRGWGDADGATTDGEGRFRLLLETGGDRIVVRARGYAELRQETDPEGGDLGDLVLADAEVITGLALAPDGSPLSGARVTASEQRQDGNNNNNRFGGPRRLNATAWSSPAGDYRLELPQPGLRWQVKASFPFLLESEEVVVQPIDGLAAEVNLHLRWGAEISGVVLGEGVPLEGASVSLSYNSERGFRNRAGGRNRTARTDATGNFMIRGLEAGTYNVRSSADGFGDARIRELVLTADQQRVVELRMEKEAVLEGVVIDQFGAPIASAQVSASDSSGAWRRSSSAADGFFSIDQLAPGPISVRADASGYLRSRLNEVDPKLGPIEIVMDQSFEFRGFVVDAETGDPIRRARVTVRAAGSRSRGQSDRTGDEGLFRVEDLRAGEYDITATAEGFLTARFSAAIPGREADETVVIELEPGGRIIVDVVDLAGGSVQGATLRAYRMEEGEEAGSDASSSQRSRRQRSDDRATTDAGGRGTLVGLADGFYRVTIRHDEYVPAESVAVVKRIEGSARVRVVLERGATIRGEIRSASGNLLSNGNVSAVGPVTKRVDAQESGQYLIQGLPPGDYQVTFQQHEQGPEPPPRGQITVSGTGERVLDLRPDP
ncbi:MAG: carboxypeptidase-like regulatory domain-containing protein [Planctomycetota bacterium]|nr:carboxypeptidase-like regulatory domain-containing protein [Planctomycetota bacterium]